MGKLGRMLDSFCLSTGSNTCFCINSMDFEEDEFERKPLVASDSGHNNKLRLMDVVAGKQTLGFQLKPKIVMLRVSMHCQGCAKKVEKHISKLEGVSSYKVDLETKMVVVIGDILPFEVLQSVSKELVPQILFPYHIMHQKIETGSSDQNFSDHFNKVTAAHVELTNYGFPVGLLPATTVLGYAVNETSGDFSVRLGDSCKITLPPDNYVATYSKTITGKIVKGKMAELEGIRVRAFFKWWSITGIRSSDDDIVFEVGMVTAKYPSKNFDESPACEGQHSSS